MALAGIKKNTLILVAIIVFLVILIPLALSLRKNSQKPATPLTETAPEEEFPLATWEDPAGFSFAYPEILEIDPHEEDEENYANLELTREGKKGRIQIFVNDSDFSTLDEWLEEDEEVKDASSLDTQVAAMKAKKVALGDGREIITFIDLDQVIYKIIKKPEGEDFWRQALKEILDSFKLTPLEGETEESFQNWLEGFETSTVDVVESVEIIE